MYLFSERGGEEEREGEKHPGVVASCMPPAGDLAHNPGMCPDWEWNQQPFGLQAGTQSTEPHQPGQIALIFSIKLNLTFLTYCFHIRVPPFILVLFYIL